MNHYTEKMPPPGKDLMFAVIHRDNLHVLRVTNQYRQKKKTQFFSSEISSKTNKYWFEISEKKLVFLYDVLNYNGRMFAMFSHT